MILSIKLLGIFAIIIIMLYKKVKLGYVMLIAAFVTAIIFDVGISSIINVLTRTFLDRDTNEIIVLLVLIMSLEKVMSNRQLMSKMIISLKNAVGDYRITSLILPAIIGVLPSVGGAIFSAPMVDEVCSEGIVENENKSFINYWYRHVWEYVSPICAGLVFASAVLHIKVEKLISLFYPYTILSIIVGIPLAFYHFPKGNSSRSKDVLKNLIGFMFNSYPIIFILMLFFIFKVDIVITILMVLISLLIIEKVSISEFWDIVRKDGNLSTIGAVIGVILLKNMLVESKVIEQMTLLFNSIGIGNLYIAVFLPLIIGIITGMMSATIGMTFPIVMNLGGSIDFNLITIAYVSSVAGTMISPMHICLVLTTEYFRASLNKVMLRVATGQIFIIICSIIVFLIFT